ncbi:MAG: class I SAM-dependent methyltransferase [Asgard group archaeon]|nr:class I SAM-dependent methyltransferase [Asgard group archaeon]
MKAKDIVKKGYNKIAEKYLEFRKRDNNIELSVFHEFLEYLPEKGLVLDVGCGAGIPFTKFISKKSKVIGVDISKKQIELAKKHVPEGTFLCMDMLNINFPCDSFDGIVCIYTIIHVPSEKHSNLLKKFQKILKPGGYLFISLSKDKHTNIEKDWFGAEMFWSSLDISSYYAILKEKGFEIIQNKELPDSLGSNDVHFIIAKKKKEINK